MKDISAHGAAAAMHPTRRRLAFLVLLTAFAMDVIDTTIVNIAMPAIRADLEATTSALQWMVAGYSTTFAVLLITGGRMGDIFGYRRLFVVGMSAFTLASLACGLAGDPRQLIIARLVQGGAAALMGPQVLAIIQLLYAPAERVRVLSFFGVLGGLAAVLGPVLGGALIKADVAGLGWRLIFLINIPIGIVGVLAGSRLLPPGRSGRALSLDLTGAALVCLLVGALIVPLIEGHDGWPATRVLLLGATLPLAIMLWRHVLARTALNGSALIEPSLFSDRGFAVGLTASLLFAVVSGGFFLVLTLTLQIGLGLDPLTAALVHVPFAFGVGFGVSVLGRGVLPRLGRNVLSLGALSMILGLTGLAALVTWGGASIFALGMALLIAGLGMGMVVGPLSPIALARIDVSHAGSASGLLKAVQQVGAALGAALIGSVFLSRHGSGLEAAATRSAFAPAVLVMIVALAIVAVLARLMPRQLFAVPTQPQDQEPAA